MRPIKAPLIALALLLLFSLAGATPHERYNQFSAPQKVMIQESHLTITDDIIYHQAHYSVDGKNWTPLQLRGTPFEQGSQWLTGTINQYLPSPVYLPGEHYLLIYTCTNLGTTWDCHGRNDQERGYWQLLVINKPRIQEPEDPFPNVPSKTSVGTTPPCGGCDSGFACNNGVCEVTDGNLYYVATDGNDANPGTIEQPWATFQHAIYQAKPGDVVYLRGGIYYHDDSIGGNPSSGAGYNGEEGKLVRFLNYPGERPILDFTAHEVDPNTGWTGSIGWHQAAFIHLRGLTIRNVYQAPPDFTRTQKPYSEGHGLGCSSCGSMLYENIIVHDINGRAFQHWSGAWKEWDAWDSYERCVRTQEAREGGNPNVCTYPEPLFDYDYSKWINCDAYNLFSKYESNPGNAADGWKVGTYLGSTFLWENNRVWNYSDDGIDPHGSGTRIFDGNWVVSTDYHLRLPETMTASDWDAYMEEMGMTTPEEKNNFTRDWDTEGNGIKTTGHYMYDSPDDLRGVQFKNNIAALCHGTGFIANLLINNQNSFSSNPLAYNNLAYRNKAGFWDSNTNNWPRSSTYHNNIAFGGYYAGQGKDNLYEVGIYYPPLYDESHNTWRAKTSESWPGWEPNPAYDVSDEDFISVDAWELTAPRRNDGSLPDVNFGRLAPDSELIDGGTIIPGYHCATPGPHPESDCREWAGTAPDLGPFEHDLPRTAECLGPGVRPCSWENGHGQQTRNCVASGQWSDWGTCTFATCKEGYEQNGDSCVIAQGEWSGELMYNGGFESSAQGWTSTLGNWESRAYSSSSRILPYEGYYVGYNNGKSNQSTFVYQDVNLTDYAAHIDQERVIINASGWARSFKASIKFIFLDENKNNITTALDTGYIEQDEWWSGSINEELVPAGTRYLRVWGNAYHLFTNNAGYLDDFSVKAKILDS